MTDDEVGALLRSPNPLVVVDAPAGCGKTYQGASYAKDAASGLNSGQVLILTHTHAARTVFAERTRDISHRVEIRTIDGFLTELASAYHRVLGLPQDVAIWARDTHNGFDVVAEKCSGFLAGAKTVASALSARYPVIICDEHQDASEAQHSAIMALKSTGSSLRIFGDPMQLIFASGANDGNGSKERAIQKGLARWEALRTDGVPGELETPHRWATGSPDLGRWVLHARTALKRGDAIDLTGPPPSGLTIHFAENVARSDHNAYMLEKDKRKPIDNHIKSKQQILMLSNGNDRVDHINSLLYRRFSIWEGHTRSFLSDLVKCIRESRGQAISICEGLLIFIESIAVGFTRSLHGKVFIEEVANACAKPRKGSRAHLQAMARHLLDAPDHKGVSRVLSHLVDLVQRAEKGFDEIKLDLKHELHDAIRLGSFNCPDEGFAEISRRRTFTHPKPPLKCLSTIHKSKGLECENAMIIPCDRAAFTNTQYKRHLLYVGLSRAKSSLFLVLSKRTPSPLFKI